MTAPGGATGPPEGPALAQAGISPPEPGRKEPVWAHWDDDKLLSLPMSELGVTFDGSAVQKRIAELYQELAEGGLVFRPHFWLSTRISTIVTCAGCFQTPPTASARSRLAGS